MFAALSFSLSLAFLALVSTAVAESIPQDNDNIDANGIESTCKSSGDGTCTSHLTSVFVIGDLHGDAVCAISWVNRTGLIANLFLDDAIDSSSSSSVTALLYQKLNNPSQWLWTSPQSTLVFVGDYVDKGPTSKQTVQFVKDLTTAFPDRVTAILGNHELELLRDRDARIPWVGKYSAYSHATVHPGEYLNYFANSLDASSSSSSSSTVSSCAVPATSAVDSSTASSFFASVGFVVSDSIVSSEGLSSSVVLGSSVMAAFSAAGSSVGSLGAAAVAAVFPSLFSLSVGTFDIFYGIFPSFTVAVGTSP
mmetsp:Transcript_23413/g.49673  ORF Transcript_23413/g.49673 Transcript_23413/m.49673 type:complete len:308 (+) Transcript_23413:79-1002(+)